MNTAASMAIRGGRRKPSGTRSHDHASRCRRSGAAMITVGRSCGTLPCMEPGWYSDPFGQGMRWWDGRTWTAHTAPAATGFYQLDPHRDLGAEQLAARRASIAVVVAALIGAVN